MEFLRRHAKDMILAGCVLLLCLLAGGVFVLVRSGTISLPSKSSKEEVQDLYLYGYEPEQITVSTGAMKTEIKDPSATIQVTELGSVKDNEACRTATGRQDGVYVKFRITYAKAKDDANKAVPILYAVNGQQASRADLYGNAGDGKWVGWTSAKSGTAYEVYAVASGMDAATQIQFTNTVGTVSCLNVK